jgi:hypothetical protein
MTKIPLTEKEILEFIQGELDTNEDEMALTLDSTEVLTRLASTTV